MKSRFFKSNMPFGIEKSDKGYWTSFNSYFKPLEDQKLTFVDHDSLPILQHRLGCKFVGLEDSDLIGMACGLEMVQRDKTDLIGRVFFYNDLNNPTKTKSTEDWKKYFSRLKLLSKFSINR